jgi:hypothetical protein
LGCMLFAPFMLLLAIGCFVGGFAVWIGFSLLGESSKNKIF